jgi:hypothetical protein
MTTAEPATVAEANERVAAAEFNERYLVGTRVIAYPGCRPDPGAAKPCCPGLDTRTRSRASVLGGHTAVVWVDGHGACIALTHVDPQEA